MLSSARSLTIVLVIALAAIAAIVVTDIRQDEVAQDAPSTPQQPDTTQPAEQLRAVATELSTPVHAARSSMVELREVTANALAGSGDADGLDEQIRARAERLREAADDVSATSDVADTSTTVAHPVATSPAMLATRIRHDASALAGQLRATADHLEDAGLAALTLRAHGETIVATVDELPASDDPDAVLAAWRAELERLDTYRADAEDAAEHPALARLADRHLEVIDRLGRVAEAATDHLDGTVTDEDIEAYDATRQQHLDALSELGPELSDATDHAITQVAADAETINERVLTFATRLDEVRRDTAETLDAARAERQLDAGAGA